MYKWKRYGGYEVSTKGDKRFSALNAILPDGRSIEMHYQCDVKGHDPGGTNWRLGKGKPPINRDRDLWTAYFGLWVVWAIDHEELLAELKQHADTIGKILSDCFANTDVNQARALAELLNLFVG